MKRTNSVTRDLLLSYPEWKIAELASPRFTPDSFHAIVGKTLNRNKGTVLMEEMGSSSEGRRIRLYSAGAGEMKILLWSQMHGDEPTATMAIADILNYFCLCGNDEPPRTILSALHLLFLPMLNPDGAARFQRRTAQGIDMNRDAVTLVTPEARLLTNLQQEHKPEFAFNLHDQELSTVGSTKDITAMAVLAPAIDQEKSDNDVRVKAKHLAAVVAQTTGLLMPGKIARYDETFEPRAFGDNMQRWGTSTVLIESGHALNDPEKQSIRRLNAVGILASLFAIATGEYRTCEVSSYESLPFNGRNAYDVVIRNVLIRHATGPQTSADLGVSYQVDTHMGETPRLVDVGDLSTFAGLREIDGGKKIVAQESLIMNNPFDWERLFVG